MRSAKVGGLEGLEGLGGWQVETKCASWIIRERKHKKGNEAEMA